MKITRPDLAALAVCALAVVGIVVLSAIHVPVPDVLPTLALVALSAGAGVATLSGSAPAAGTSEEKVTALTTVVEELLDQAKAASARATARPAAASVPAQPAAPVAA